MKIKQENKQNKKQIFPLPIHVYLSYLVVCTLLLTGVSFSSYISSASAGDSAQVAAGVVVVNYDTNTEIELKRPTDNNHEVTKNFNFSVSNSVSEVAIQYDVVVMLEKALPEGITMKLDGTSCSGNSSNTYTFSNMGTFEAGTVKSIPHQLTFTGDFNVYNTPGEAEFPIKISVYAKQID